MLTIGEFSRICFVTRKTLRHYDEIGLLRPEHIAENGYRYYTAGQLRTMLLISKLKGYGLSLPEIAAVLADPDEEKLAARLEEKRKQLETDAQSIEQVLAELERDIGKLQRRMDIMEENIVVKTVTLESSTLYGVRRTISVDNFGELFGELFAGLERNRIQPMGPPMAFYHDEDFDRNHTDVEVSIPVAPGTKDTRKQPGGLHCFATILGPYGDASFSAAYAGLVKWIEENGYRVTSAPFEKYVKGQPDTRPEDYVTEVYFPIAKK